MTLFEASQLLSLPMNALITDEETFEDNLFDDLFDKNEQEMYNDYVEVSKREYNEH